MISFSFRLADSSVTARAVVREQALPDELLGDRRGAARPAAERVDPRGDDADRVEARVLPEARVLDRRGGVDEDRRDVLERDDLAVELAEPRELHLVLAVPDDRLLGQHDGLEFWGFGSPLLSWL